MIRGSIRIIQMMLLGIVFLSMSGFHWWDPIARWIGIGNEAYREGQFDQAEAAYNQAQEAAPDSNIAALNRGSAQYQAGRYDESVANFEQAARSGDPALKAQAHYNSGCAQLSKGDAAKAVDSFRKSLIANPHDEDAKANLEMALKMKEQQPSQPPQPQEGSPQPDESGSPSPTPETSPSPEQQTPQSDGSPQPQETQSESDSQTPTPQSAGQTQPTPSPSDQTPAPAPQPASTAEPPKDGEMDKAEAERLLDLMETEELEVLKRFHQLPEVDERNVDKDW